MAGLTTGTPSGWTYQGPALAQQINRLSRWGRFKRKPLPPAPGRPAMLGGRVRTERATALLTGAEV
jgi:hypothetical protein